jgi:glycosyltransferase involved in cell wall biosynthesis
MNRGDEGPMKLVIFNALNSNSGGGKSIRDSYLRLLDASELTDRYVVIAARSADLPGLSNPMISVERVPEWWSRAIIAPLAYGVLLGRLSDRLGANVVFNIGDLVIRTRARQLYLFDWPYALHVHPRVWSTMTYLDWLNRRVKLVLLAWTFARPDVVVAQTVEIKQRLEARYGLRDVRVVGNAPTNVAPLDSRDLGRSLPPGIKLVYPAIYYPHKNHAVLLDLARLIKTRGLNYRIIVTITPRTPAAHAFLASIDHGDLGDVLVNVGEVSPDRMGSLYAQCDGLMMPTLLESFSIVYVEAMQRKLPIFTSDMWFARAVCGDAARYFDPFDANDILTSLNAVYGDLPAKRALTEAGQARLASFPTWKDNFASFQDMLKELLGRA